MNSINVKIINMNVETMKIDIEKTVIPTHARRAAAFFLQNKFQQPIEQ